jgi:allophanate hydrolase subunit 2
VLRKDDALSIGNASPRKGDLPDAPHITEPVHVIAGPDVDQFPDGLAELTEKTWRIGARRDRTGVQLAGSQVRRLASSIEAPSTPMVRGAIQVPPNGEPIVLGPDHPTTGGYPVIAVIASSHLGSFFARSTGAALRFTDRRP